MDRTPPKKPRGSQECSSPHDHDLVFYVFQETIHPSFAFWKHFFLCLKRMEASTVFFIRKENIKQLESWIS